MSVIKRDRNASSKDLIEAIENFIELLSTQDEADAVADLIRAKSEVSKDKPGSASHTNGLKLINAAFGDEHELSSYILEKPNPEVWDITQRLSQAGARVLTLVRRFQA